MIPMIYFIVKRAFDIIASCIGLILLSPIWIVAILGIELSDFGPIFYLAKRIGKDNKVFSMFKFRSMRVQKNANEKNFKADTDRIFGFGKIIRQLKIDELPQLLNILLGDMSIVGPRPVAMDQADIMLDGKYSEVTRVRPGLTGSAALYDYIYGDSIEDEQEYKRLVLPTRKKLELEYIRNMSLFYDMELICLTIYCIGMTMIGKTPDKLLKHLEKKSESIET